MTNYLHFINDVTATVRNEALADELGCGPVTQLWFNQLSHADGRRAFEVVNTNHEAYLNQAERDALVGTLWYQNALSGNIYVTADGTQDGDGSIGDPVNLATVCSALSTVALGSIIHVTPGNYEGDFVFIHDGASDNRIVINFEFGAKIEGSFTLNGNYVTCIAVDVFNTHLSRLSAQVGSAPTDIVQREGLSIYGIGAIFAHPKVQDAMGNGCGFWQTSYNSILYGLWTLNNGWDAPDRGHGHGLYTQNGTLGPKLIRNCVLAQGYSGGIRAYTTNQELAYTTVDRCISIHDQIHLGGHSPASQCAITNNRIWTDGLEIGETDRGNGDVIISGNYVVNSPNTRCFVFRFWDDLTAINNVFVMRQNNGLGLLGEYLRLSPTTETINNNTYYYEPRVDGKYFLLYDYATEPPVIAALSIAEWRALGYDTNSTFIEGMPALNQIFVEHSEYDNNICHVAIYNWEGLAAAPVDLSGGNFTLAGTYRAYNAMNPDEYHEFIYTGLPTPLPMSGWTVAIPSGATGPLQSPTWPEFMAFVVKIAP